jgi:Ni,Fe-hydrogenase III large subunit/Ni,Fe-hydrogenase III component G
MPAEKLISELRAQFAFFSAITLERNELYCDVNHQNTLCLPKICLYLRDHCKARFVSAWATDERAVSDAFRLYYVFSLTEEDLFLIVRAWVPAGLAQFPSVAAHMICANWAEREIYDTFGLLPTGHPNLKKLWAMPDWPEATYAMRKDFALNAEIARQAGELEFRRVEGEGVFEIPVGPVHAGIIEPGHFRFSVAGEPIINLQLQLYYVHKGIEKLCEGSSVEKALHVSERISGDATFAHATAFCLAVERLANVEVPRRAQWLRMLFLELERIYNHLSDIGMIANDVAFLIGYAHAMRLREKILQLNEKLTGSRLLRGVSAFGGVRRDVPSTAYQSIRKTLETIEKELTDLAELLWNSASVMDRLETTGVLAHKTAQDIGVVGIAARASGIDRDSRRDHPHLLYRDCEFRVPVYHQGDVCARTRVRVDEILESFKIIYQILAKLEEGEIRVSLQKTPANACALGYTETWRGPTLHVVQTDNEGKIFRYKIDEPSFHNWPALVFAVQGNIVPDFPLINKSFNLSYSGNDR